MTDAKEDKFTILLVADNFDPHFAPITVNTPWGNWHLGSTSLLDLALDWISLVNAPNVPNILVVSATLGQAELQDCERKWAYNFRSFKTVFCQNCTSVGQLMREIYSRGFLQKTNFMLIDNLATFCSSSLVPQIETFKALTSKKDSDVVMFMLYSRQISGEARYVGFETETQKLISYQGVKEGPISTIEQSMFTRGVTIRSDLAPCGITLCTSQVVTQFTDNFDFEQFDQVIRDYLVNDEVYGSVIRVEILPEDVVCFTATDYGSLLRAQRLLIHRWCYPLTYDRLPARVFDNQVPLRYHRKHVYVPRNEEEPSNAQGTVLGRNCKISTTAELLDVTMGNECAIGEYVKMHNVIAGHNLNVGSNSEIDGVVIGDNVTIHENVVIKPKTVIGDNVVIQKGSGISQNSAVMAREPPDEEDIKCRQENGYFLWRLRDEPSGHFWRRSHSFTNARRERHASEMSRSSIQTSLSQDDNTTSEDQTDGMKADPILDSDMYYNVFLNEVHDSMMGAFDSELRADVEKIKSLIVDINSSRFANNMSQDDVAKGVFTAFLSMPPIKRRNWAETKELFIDWIMLWNNYYKTDGNKMQLLVALEDAANNNPTMMTFLPHVLVLLYNELTDVEFEDSIMEWYNGVPDDSPIKANARPAIEILAQDSEEEDDDSEENDA